MLRIFNEIYAADYTYRIKGIVWIYQFSRDYTDDQLYISEVGK